VKDATDRWHRITTVIEKESGDKREVICGVILEDNELEQMIAHDLSNQDSVDHTERLTISSSRPESTSVVSG